jgi:hypothetical protein
MSRRKITGIAVAVLLAAVSVWASVTFNPVTGTGFVGKGDVQSAFGWNNAQAQANIDYISFFVRVTQERTQQCRTDPGQIFTGVRSGTRSVSDHVAFNPRIHHQIDGIYLDGYQGTSDTSDWSEWGPFKGPGNGDGCPAGTNGDDGHPFGQITEGAVVVQGLFVSFNGNSVQIWP